MRNLVLGIIVVIVILGFIFLGSSQEGDNLDDLENTISPTVGMDEVDLEVPEGGMKYMVNSEDTELAWAASRIVGSDHSGTVTVSEGEVVMLDDEFVAGAFVIDMTSITDVDDNEQFLGHVRSDDFFAVDQYPTARLVITSLDVEEDEDTDATHMVTADLTIRDITNEISFPAIVSETTDQLLAQASFEVDRTKWDIIFDSSNFFQNLGDRAIRDDIEYDLTLVMDLEDMDDEDEEDDEDHDDDDDHDEE